MKEHCDSNIEDGKSYEEFINKGPKNYDEFIDEGFK